MYRKMNISRDIFPNGTGHFFQNSPQRFGGFLGEFSKVPLRTFTNCIIIIQSNRHSHPLLQFSSSKKKHNTAISRDKIMAQNPVSSILRFQLVYTTFVFTSETKFFFTISCCCSMVCCDRRWRNTPKW